MADEERFIIETLQARKADLIEILRDNTIARLIFPVETSLRPDQSVYEYYKIAEVDNSQYELELRQPDYSRAVTRRAVKAVPLVQNDIQFKKHDVSRAQNDILSLQRRVDIIMEQCVEQENARAIAGKSTIGVTSFADETNNVSDMTTSLDLTSYATCQSTLETAVTEARTDLKDKAYNASEKHILWTSDVDARARGALATYDEHWSAYDLVGAVLARENGVNTNGFEFIHYSDYLGSETGAGTTNTCFICKHPQNFVLLTSPVEQDIAQHSIEGLAVQIDWRCLPVFFRTEACHYDSATDVTA